MITPQIRAIILTSLFIMLTGNLALFQRLLEIYPLTLANLPFLISLTSFFTIATTLFLLALCHGRASRWLLAFFLVAATQAAYYMDKYGVVIDVGMIDNIAQTNIKELTELISISLVVRTLLLGIFPAYLAIKFGGNSQGVARELKARGQLILVLVITLAAVIAPFTAEYSAFIRGHKMTRYYANPTIFSISAFQFLKQQFQSTTVITPTTVAPDARKISASSKHKLIFLVVGETARADRFSLNGYARETNPELKKRDVVSFTHVTSCGTSTRMSVPCMFSVLKRSEFSIEKARHLENALDILARNGVEVLWRDNNSESKEVATRVKYESFRSPAVNPACDSECRDIGMLGGLDEFIGARKNKDILIVMHSMGNHGPEYFRRYPKEFERYKPACKSNIIRDCSKEEIDNAYDNAILYTDFFLSGLIDFLKRYDDQFATAMFYVSDHGESLGENGIYLHAMPYASAPPEQTHVPAVAWVGQHFNYTIDQITPYRDYPLSHDDLFCLLLIGYGIETKTCDSKKDVLMAGKN